LVADFDELRPMFARPQSAATHTRMCHIAGHPYWQTPAGTPAARMALKELARIQVRPCRAA
jgi:hypothetical protein